jgi:hypothetical protein
MFLAGLLAHGSSYSPRLPIQNVKRDPSFVKRRRKPRFYEMRFTKYDLRPLDSGVAGFRPHLQRRDREGIAPSSLIQASLCGGTLGEGAKLVKFNIVRGQALPHHRLFLEEE